MFKKGGIWGAMNSAVLPVQGYRVAVKKLIGAKVASRFISSCRGHEDASADDVCRRLTATAADLPQIQCVLGQLVDLKSFFKEKKSSGACGSEHHPQLNSLVTMKWRVTLLIKPEILESPHSRE